jgi:hypothetical protein
MLRPFSAFFLLILLVAGCALRGSSSATPAITAYEPDGEARVVEAPREATYALYQHTAADEISTKGPEEVRAQVLVPIGKPIGFEKGPGDDLLAVAGETKFSLPEGEYWWRCATVPDGFYKTIFKTIVQGPEIVGERLDFIWPVLKPVGFLAYFLLPFAGALR